MSEASRAICANTRSRGIGPDLLAWLAGGVREAHHMHGDEILTLAEAARRLYPGELSAWEDGLRWPRWEHMRAIYARTKGQKFVLDPGPELLAIVGVDVGPLYIWSALWRFAGAPNLNEHGEADEPPSWAPPPDGCGLDYWEGLCGPGFVTPRPWVARLREMEG